MKKVVLFPFRGDLMCFIHVLLNALDMKAKGYEVAIVIEGAATTLIAELVKPENPMHGLYAKTKEAGLIAGACLACATKLGAKEAVAAEGIPFLGDMQGHPSMAGYIDQGYEVVTF